MSSYVTEFFWSKSMVFELLSNALLITNIRLSKTLGTLSYIAIKPYVEFQYISYFLQDGTRQQEMLRGHPKRIWKAEISYFTPLNHLRPSGLIPNSCTLVHHITTLLENLRILKDIQFFGMSSYKGGAFVFQVLKWTFRTSLRVGVFDRKLSRKHFHILSYGLTTSRKCFTSIWGPH